MTLLESVFDALDGVVTGLYPLCPFHLFGLQRSEREGIVLTPLPSVNHPDVADTFDPYIIQVGVYHSSQATAWARATCLFKALDAYKRTTGNPDPWELDEWAAYRVRVDSPRPLGEVDVDGAKLQLMAFNLEVTAKWVGT